MLISEMNYNDLAKDKNQIDKLIFTGIEDDGKSGDLIFVFGSGKLIRIEKAISLYTEKRAPLILVSGGNCYGKRKFIEAEHMKNYAIEKYNIPEKDIITETKSNNTKENVQNSLRLFEELNDIEKIKRILIVTAPFHVRRCVLTFKKYWPSHIKYTYCPYFDDKYHPDNWNNNEKAKKIVLNEARNLIIYVEKKDIKDMDIAI